MLKQSIYGLGLVLFSGFVAARGVVDYEVTITNITPGQSFTPQLIVTHRDNYRIFQLGLPAGDSLEMLAEGGDTDPLTDEVANLATDVQTVPGLLGPGQTVSTVISGQPGRGRISIAAMLIPTNDTFVALNGMPLPIFKTVEYLVPAYDAGTELNDQSCQNIPGPRCGGGGYSAEVGEGYVHIGNGFHELGDQDEDGFEVLGPQSYDWRNSVARIVVRRMRR